MLSGLAWLPPAAVGCSRSSAPTADVRAPPAAVVPDATRFQPVTSAARCEECHGRSTDEWRTSAHARAATSPLYVAMRAAAGGAAEAAACDECHAPLSGIVAPDEAALREGVTCDVCHSLREVLPTRAGAGFSLHTADNVKYGPLCDAEDHYFHKMGCSPLHARGRLCGGCHLLYRKAVPEDLPVFTEFEEWQAGPRAKTPCQQCHMAGRRGEAARGSPVRPSVSHHGDFGADGKLRQRAVTLKMHLSDAGAHVRATVTLTNSGAGHKVPTGLPGRRLLLKLAVLDAAGGTQDSAEKSYGRVLVDARGGEVPFFRAERLADDNRLAPGESRVETFDLAAPSAGEVRVSLWWSPLSPALVRSLGVGFGPDELLAEAKLLVGPPKPRGRSRLPASVTVPRPETGDRRSGSGR